MENLRVCFLTSELAPLAKTGGLADVSAALAGFLDRRGHDVRLFLPLYDRIAPEEIGAMPVDFLQDVPVEMGGRVFRFSVLTAALPDSDLMVYLVGCPPLYQGRAIYTNDADEHLRFVLLCRAALEACQGMGWAPQIVHCNDWQTALVPALLETIYSWDRLFESTRTLLTIHNIGFQGTFPTGILEEIRLEKAPHVFPAEDLRRGHVNFLKTGILHAGALTTVSPTYAREIQTPEYGMGLETLLRSRSDRLVGILNGVDYGEWNPETDRYLKANYSAQDLGGKETNKAHVLERLGLSYEKDVPLAGVVSRLTGQKGFELMLETLPAILSERRFQLVVLGDGEERFENFFHDLEERFPSSVRFHNGFSNELAHQIEAGADLFLMPSRYEPCGLNQMYSLRYGTIPVVRKTGGLADTVQLWDPDEKDGTGVVFDHYTQEGFHWALRATLDLYEDKESWSRLIQNAMARDYSWDRQGEEYEALYTQLIEKKPIRP